MNIDQHWGTYLPGAFAMANAFGPEWLSGQRNAMRTGPAAKNSEAALELVVIDAMSVATVHPPERLSATTVALLVETGNALWSVFDRVARGQIDEGVAVLNGMLERFRARPTLIRHGPAKHWHLHFSPQGSGLGQRWASDFTIATAMVVGSADFVRVGICAAERCDRAFYDETRNSSQAFCSVQCQSRVKTAAMRRRRAAAEQADPERLADGQVPSRRPVATVSRSERTRRHRATP